MRRFFFSAAIMAIVVGGPLQARGGDREIAQQIINNLKVHRDAGSLKDFTLDLKVDQGVVLLRGSVQRPDQKASVLAAANGIDGISRVVDEIEVRQDAATPTADAAAIVRPQAAVAEVTASPENATDQFSFKEALVAAGPSLQTSRSGQATVAPAGKLAADQRTGAVQMAAATEAGTDADAQITAAVVATLGAAQRQGRLKGFGVDVNTRDGKVVLSGRASTPEQRRLIADLVRQTPGVVGVTEDIAVVQPGAPRPAADREVEPLPQPYAQGGTPAMVASSRTPANVPVQTAPYRTDQGVPASQVGVGLPVHGGYAGMPVPMGPYAGVAAGPRYEQPYLPNYAWPGYAAYPNYAAVSYPQQYSPSAFPYIGPFYPYPQVPLGWRKVSLEWDDGWWFLDFTDR
jgi:osmotically-inducible protein OsmY